MDQREDVEKEIKEFFGALFQGHHRRGAINSGKTFEPDFSNIEEFLGGLGQLSDTSQDKIIKEVSMEELELAVESMNNHKSPGLDGLTAEFYKKTLEVTKYDLLDILNCQLQRMKLIESDKHGATRLGPKVEGTPRVDQLRPITLLNLDYKILSKILTNRLF